MDFRKSTSNTVTIILCISEKNATIGIDCVTCRIEYDTLVTDNNTVGMLLERGFEIDRAREGKKEKRGRDIDREATR